MSTEEMVRRCIGKDEAAWDEFVRKYQGLVRKAAYYKLYKTSPRASRNDVDDIVQEVFLALWKDSKLAKLRDISRLSGWLVVVTINQTATYRRQRYKKETMTTSLSERISEDIATTLEDIIPCNQPDPAQSAEMEEVLAQLEDGINSLRMKEKTALKLKIYDGKKQHDIAKIMTLPLGSVTCLISRAKKKVHDNVASEFCASPSHGFEVAQKNQ